MIHEDVVQDLEVRLHEIANGSADEILTFILDYPMPEMSTRDLDNPKSFINNGIRQAWRGGQPHNYIKSPIETPIFIESSDRADFASSGEFEAAIRSEILARRQQSHFFKVFESVVDATDNPGQFNKLIQVFGYLQEKNKDKKLFIPSRFARQLIERSVAYVEDPEAGDASPDEVAMVATPAISRLLKQQHEGKTDQEVDEVNIKVSSYLLGRGEDYGTAEQVAILRTRELLSDMGYSGFSDTGASKRHQYRVSERYITSATLNEISEALGEDYSSLAADQAALSVIQGVVLSTLRKLEANGSQRAKSILLAFNRLSQRSLDPYATQEGLALNTTIHIANAITPDLNERENLCGDQELERLDVHDHSQLPYAFQRILFAVSPDLLARATEGRVRGAEEIRLRMVYIEALAQQWADYRRVQGPTVGDFVLRLKAKGLTDEAVARQLEAMTSGQVDSRASDGVHQIVRDSETSKNHVTFNIRKPGYGAYS